MAGKSSMSKKFFFETHQSDCKYCSEVDIKKASTLSKCCPQGSEILKEYLIEIYGKK